PCVFFFAGAPMAAIALAKALPAPVLATVLARHHPVPTFLFTLRKNPLRVLPAAKFPEPIYRYRKRGAWRAGPALTKTLLFDARDEFAKTLIVMPSFAIDRHQRRWSDPDWGPFAPEREAGGLRRPCMALGAGLRLCIGLSFAMAEAATMLAALPRAVRLEL